MITRIDDIQPLLRRGRADPASALPELRRLAISDQWQTREVAATGLVEIGKRHAAAVVKEAGIWADSANPNLRRAASEGLRGIVKQSPELVWPVLERLRADPELYVRKSVANVLRNAGARHPEAVLALCRKWVKGRDPDTLWIVSHGLKKLRTSHRVEVDRILDSGA